MYSEQTLSEIRARLNIVELVGEYVSLKKSGQGYQGLCPFHQEKTPSFHVHPIKQIFHCFGCQKGGNIFSFLSAIEGLNFPESVQRLAKRTGVTLEETKYRRPQKREPDAATEKLLAAQEWAAKYFHYLLMESQEGEMARQYLKSRGLSRKTVEKFRIGISPKGWDTALKLMLKRGFTVKELVQAGLVIEKEGSPTGGYDRFRQRLMFPIHDAEGNVIGFGARILTQEENQPKYINSPESPLFSKRRVLYGLYENQRGVRLKGEAVIVEGYMDVVGLYECGVNNALATMGTAMTEENCAQLKGLTRRVVTVFDPDKAGNDAWHRSVHLLISAGIFAKDLSLPDGKDPDEFALAEGAEKFYALCERAPRQVTKLLKEIASKGPLSEEQSSKLLQDLTPILVASRRLPDRATLWDDMSLVLNLKVETLKELSETAVPGMKPNDRKPEPTRQPQKWEPPRKLKTLHPLDLEFFQACLGAPEIFLKTPIGDWKAGLKEPKVLEWLEKLALSGSPANFESVLQSLVMGDAATELIPFASAKLVEQAPTSEQGKLLYDAVLNRIRMRKKELEIRALSAQVKLTQRLGNSEEQMRLLERLKELRSS